MNPLRRAQRSQVSSITQLPPHHTRVHESFLARVPGRHPSHRDSDEATQRPAPPSPAIAQHYGAPTGCASTRRHYRPAPRCDKGCARPRLSLLHLPSHPPIRQSTHPAQPQKDAGPVAREVAPHDHLPCRQPRADRWLSIGWRREPPGFSQQAGQGPRREKKRIALRAKGAGLRYRCARRRQCPMAL